MHLPGDRMITCLMAELSRAGVKEIVLDKNLNVSRVMPKIPLRERMTTNRHAAKITRTQAATAAVHALLADHEKKDVYGDRTFSAALAFRLGPRVEADETVRLLPKKFEIRKVIDVLDT